MKKMKIYMVISILTILLLIVSCSNVLEEKNFTNTESNKSNSYNLTIHEYILLEYNKRYSTDHFIQILEENSSYFIRNNKVDYCLVSDFIVNNIHLFSDSLLYSEIVIEACDIFGIPDLVDKIPNAFSKESMNLFLDYNNSFGGINLMQETDEDMQNELFEYYSDNVMPFLTEEEKINEMEFFELMKNDEDIENVIAFFEHSLDNSNFTDSYLNTLKFGYNTYKFYNSGDISTIKDIYEGATDYLAYQSLYEAYEPQCRQCMHIAELPLSHSQHLALAGAGVARPSKIIGVLVLIKNILSFYFDFIW
ncbi:MAG: hypothetical protein M0Q94_16065 [Candidatus Cloacimonetes bacterium]|nr:hypothetical protein [Candidatus Cloacimonadota bacterium]